MHTLEVIHKKQVKFTSSNFKRLRYFSAEIAPLSSKNDLYVITASPWKNGYYQRANSVYNKIIVILCGTPVTQCSWRNLQVVTMISVKGIPWQAEAHALGLVLPPVASLRAPNTRTTENRCHGLIYVELIALRISPHSHLTELFKPL
jgi:hypothetical protein